MNIWGSVPGNTLKKVPLLPSNIIFSSSFTNLKSGDLYSFHEMDVCLILSEPGRELKCPFRYSAVSTLNSLHCFTIKLAKSGKYF